MAPPAGFLWALGPSWKDFKPLTSGLRGPLGSPRLCLTSRPARPPHLTTFAVISWLLLLFFFTILIWSLTGKPQVQKEATLSGLLFALLGRGSPFSGVSIPRASSLPHEPWWPLSLSPHLVSQPPQVTRGGSGSCVHTREGTLLHAVALTWPRTGRALWPLLSLGGTTRRARPQRLCLGPCAQDFRGYCCWARR